MGYTTGTSSRGIGLGGGRFEATFAAFWADRSAEYRLRWDVFVREKRWEIDRFPDQQERDALDPFASAFVLRDTQTGAVAATQRLILRELLPPGIRTGVEERYIPLADRPRIDFTTSPTSWAEASRTTIAAEYRRAGTAAGQVLGAMTLCTAALAIAFGRRTTLFSLSERGMAHLMEPLVAMEQVGERVLHHGRRATFRICVSDMVSRCAASEPEAFQRLVRAASDCARDSGFRRVPDLVA